MAQTVAARPAEVRFEFGKNWGKFARLVDQERIEAAERSLKSFLPFTDLRGKRFLDIGCGSGLLSLAARRLGAEVHSFDYDVDAVECSRRLRDGHDPDDDRWTIEQGSVLDRDYLTKLGSFDIVYSWGVLHHTGAMWQALDNAQLPVKPGGYLYIAIYNDQGGASRRWTSVKRIYNRSPKPVRLAMVVAVGGVFFLRGSLVRLVKLRNPFSVKGETARKKQDRGMSVWHDLVDWVGGYPFEVAKPEEIFDFFAKRSFSLEKLKTCAGGLGCNEFVFRRRSLNT
jgi:2-polyprenyl-3-methyl-5-hydroxy-6-metoxy-1,4-benzoquinol methylase